jgi:hypothetical protein
MGDCYFLEANNVVGRELGAEASGDTAFVQRHEISMQLLAAVLD